jgi:hypothetical protein
MAQFVPDAEGMGSLAGVAWADPFDDRLPPGQRT